MLSHVIEDCLAGRTTSSIRPFIWYGGESCEKLAKEIEAVKAANIDEFVLENRGGDWFCTERWWKVMDCALQTAERLGMRVWLLDDSHVNTGSANGTLKLPENAKFRPQNLRIEAADVAGPLCGGALMVPNHTDKEKVVSVSAFRRDEGTGHCIGEPLVFTELHDDICLVDLPAGLWRVFFVMTADPGRVGLFANYITMLSPESCRHLIDEVHEKIYTHYAKYFGNTFAGFFTDEPAFGNCDGQYGYDSCDHRMGQLRRLYPWWDTMPELLARKVGLTTAETMAKLPALWDDVDGASDLFRVAYMDVITDLWRKNFSRQLGDWCHAHKVEFIGHVLEDGGSHMRMGWGCGHFFRSMEGQDMAGLDVVLNQIVPGFLTIKHVTNSAQKEYDSVFYHYTLAKLGASLAHLTPHMRNRAMCEVFGAYGWTLGLPLMRAILNHFLANGVNQYTPHAYSMHLPSRRRDDRDEGDNAPPGYCKIHMAPSFYMGGLNPQYRQFGELMAYLRRCSHLISEGVHQADVALFYAAEADWANCKARSMDDVAMTLSRNGIDFDFIPSDALHGQATVKNKRLVIGEEDYAALIIPMAETYPEQLLRLFAFMAEQGLPVIFTDAFPQRCERPNAELSALLATMNVSPLEELPSLIHNRFGTRLQICNDEISPNFRYYGVRQNDGNLLYLCYNDGMSLLETHVGCGKSCCTIYHPWKNIVYRARNDRRGFCIKLQPQELLAVCFSDSTDEILPEYPYEAPTFRELPLRYDIYMRENTEKEFRLLRSDSKPVNLLREEKLYGGCAEFRYETVWERDGDDDAQWLRIPCAGDCAELWVNGQYCGLELGPDCRFFIGGKLHQGQNRIVILTADNPAYFDRNMKEGFVYGTKLPMPPHGFCGDIQIG